MYQKIVFSVVFAALVCALIADVTGEDHQPPGSRKAAAGFSQMATATSVSSNSAMAMVGGFVVPNTIIGEDFRAPAQSSKKFVFVTDVSSGRA